MAKQANSTSKLFALLIGIDCYLPNTLPGGSSYTSLQGCVRDINHVEAFLKNNLQVPPAQILKLTASHSDNSKQPKEPLEQLPTYENIVAKFRELIELAQPQDQVYIHYSGHGGRAATIYPELKGKNGVDETLVPTDIGNSEARYLRDLELAKILQNMVDKALVVTVVLDSCHSGGATRGGVNDSDIRGLNKDVVDTTSRPTESLVASTDELIQTWQSLTAEQKNTRNVTATSGWLPEPKGYVLLAACRDNEYAYEYAFNGKERNGALTYWLLDSLQKLGNEVSYKVIHARILAKVNTQFERQIPMLQGEGDRVVFSGQSTSSQSSVIVKKVDLAKNRVLLQAGEAQGLRKGAEFAIYNLGTSDFSQTHKRVALAKIVEVGAEESWAEVTAIFKQENTNVDNYRTTRDTSSNPVRSISAVTSPQPEDTLRLYTPPPSEAIIEDGAPALLLSPGVKLVRKVRLLPPEEHQQPLGINPQEALAAVKAAKAKVEGNGWVEFLSFDEKSDEPVTYQVSVNAQGEYEILDAGGEPIINLRPTLKVGDSDAAASVVNRLVHLSKYHAALQLDNNDPLSPLAGKLNVELCTAGENRQLIPINAPGNVPTLNVDEYAFLRIRNESDQVLNITVLAIQPDWSIAQLHPGGAAAFEPLDPGMEKLIRFQTSLPEGYNEGADVLKVFATVGAANFGLLKLPALDQPRRGIEGTRATNPLEELLAAVASEQPPNRNISAAAYPSEKWTIEQVKLVVKV
ncbi:caspase family protein [Mastigocladopsis repens]|uniref:caspase family protein n=1 Tax=Mastigocladopsis repens TaxID=221287 RepID=UPI0002D6ED5A|nr:caspase family protein [Mastigocladopsis repens]